MATKRNRCKVKSCSVVIPEVYHFCYMHRKWSLADVKQEQKEIVKPPEPMRRFWCDPCGTVYMSHTPILNCRACGHKMEEVKT